MEWYEDLGFEENPFVDTENTTLIGYDDAIQEINYRIAAGDILFIEGEEGTGKTALLKRVIARFKGRGKIVYLDGKKIEKNINITETIRKSRGFWQRMMGREPENLILLMDDVEKLTRKNSERIKYFYDQNYIRAVIFTGRNYKNTEFTESLKERISKVIELKEPSEEDTVEIVKARLNYTQTIPEDIIKEIYKKSNGNIKTVMENCSKVLDHAIREQGTTTITMEHLSIIGISKPEKKEEKKKKEEDKEKKKEEIGKKKEDIDIKIEQIEDEKQRPTKITIIDDDFKPKKETKKEGRKEISKEKDIAEEYY